MTTPLITGGNKVQAENGLSLWVDCEKSAITTSVELVFSDNVYGRLTPCCAEVHEPFVITYRL